MPELRRVLSEAGLEEVRTYIQSGNVTFASRVSASRLEKTIEEHLEASLGPGIRALVRSHEEIAKVGRENPFVAEGVDLTRLYVTFLGSAPRVAAPDGDYRPNRFRLVGKEIYLHCPDGYGRTKLDNAFFERKLGVMATTRNWKTVTTLERLAAG